MSPENVVLRFASHCPLLGSSLTVSILCFFPHPAIGAEWDVVGKAAVLMEMQTGKILWEKNKEAPRPPASTAKILTALVTLDRVPLKEIVTVSITAIANKSSADGERPRVDNKGGAGEPGVSENCRDQELSLEKLDMGGCAGQLE